MNLVKSFKSCRKSSANTSQPRFYFVFFKWKHHGSGPSIESLNNYTFFFLPFIRCDLVFKEIKLLNFSCSSAVLTLSKILYMAFHCKLWQCPNQKQSIFVTVWYKITSITHRRVMSISVMYGNWSLIFRNLQLNTESIDASQYRECKAFSAHIRQEEISNFKDGRGNYDIIDMGILKHHFQIHTDIMQ